MTALGVVFRPQLPPERLRGVVRTAEDAGLDQLWLWEDCFFESGMAAVAAALGWTERLRVGVGLLPVPLRNVTLTAMEAATLHRLFPERPILAVGHGNQAWMAQAGEQVDSPITLLREYVTAMRALLRGERLSTQGRYVTLDDVALEYPPATAPAVLTGAVGPRTVRLAGEVADGTVLDASTPPEGVRRARRLIDEGRATAGRTDHHELVVYLTTVTGPDAAARLQAEHEFWGNDSVPGLGAAGDADTVAKAIARLVDAGADTVVCVPVGDEPDVEGLVRFVAEEVRPLVP